LNLPHSKDVEQEVLGGILIDNNKMKEVIDNVSPKDFYFDVNKIIFNAMAYLYYNHEPIDYQLIVDRLKYKEQFSDDILNYILGLSDTVASTVNFDHKVNLLKDYAGKRHLYETASWITNNDISGISNENLKEKIEGQLEKLNLNSNIETHSVSESLEDWYINLKNGEPAGAMMFGMKLLDDHIVLKPKNLGIIAARPSLGKSAYALYLALNFAQQNKRTLFVSLEMSKEEVIDRIIARLSKVEYRKISRKEDLSQSDFDAIQSAMKKLEDLPLDIYDKGQMNVDHLYNYSKLMKKENNIDVVMVDYLQLLESGQNKRSDNENVSYISRKLKLIAQELDVPVIALSQLSRAPEQHQGGKKSVREPQLSDLRSSGSLEQDANYVVMLHSEDVDNKFDKEKFIKAFIRKNRSGKLGTIDLTYYGDIMTFEEKEWVNGKPVTVEQTNFDIETNDEELPF